MNNFKGYQTFLNETFLTALTVTSTQSLQKYAVKFRNALDNLKEVTTIVTGVSKTQNLNLVFFISVSHLNMFSHIIIAWLWLRQVEIATKSLESEPYDDDVNFYNEKIQAMKYFF
jgi:butyryl-CoA dehydrogenase